MRAPGSGRGPAGASTWPLKLLGPLSEALEGESLEAISRPMLTFLCPNLLLPGLGLPGLGDLGPWRQSGGWSVLGSPSLLTPNVHLRGVQRRAGEILALGRLGTLEGRPGAETGAGAPSLASQVVG